MIIFYTNFYMLLGIGVLLVSGWVNGKSLSEQIEELQKTSNHSSPFDVDSIITHHSTKKVDLEDNESSTVVYRPSERVHSISLSPSSSSSSSSPSPDLDLSGDSLSREDPLQKILPKVRFNCSGRPESYYADPDFNCEVFHYCKTNGFRFTFVCPPRSQFNQKQMTCDYDKPSDRLCSKPSESTSPSPSSDQFKVSTSSTEATASDSKQSRWPFNENDGPVTSKNDLSYGFEPMEHGPRPYGDTFAGLMSGHSDEEDLNRGNANAQEVLESSKKPVFSDPNSNSMEAQTSLKNQESSESSKEIDTPTESTPDIVASTGHDNRGASKIKPFSYSSPIPDLEHETKGDGGFKPVFLEKGGPRRYSTVPPPVLEIEATDNSGKVDLPVSHPSAYATFSSTSSTPSSPTPSYPGTSSTTASPSPSLSSSSPITMTSPPRSKYHSIDDGNDLKPITKIMVQPIDLNYLSNSSKNSRNRSKSTKSSPPVPQQYGYRPALQYYSKPVSTKVKNDANKINNGASSTKVRVNKPTKYSTYQLFDEIVRPTSGNPILPDKPKAAKGAYGTKLNSLMSTLYSAPTYSEDVERDVYPTSNLFSPSPLSSVNNRSNATVSSAFLESQALKFAQIANMNLEKANRIRDAFGFDYTALAQADLPIFHPVYDRYNPSGHRATLQPVNTQLQEKFVQEKEQLFSKLREQYAQDQLRKKLQQSLKQSIQSQSASGQPAQSALYQSQDRNGIKSLSNLGQNSMSNLIPNSLESPTQSNLLASSSSPVSSIPSQAMLQLAQSSSLLPSVTLDDDDTKYPDYFYGLPKLTPLSSSSNSIKGVNGNSLFQSLASNPSQQISSYPSYTESNFGKKPSQDSYRLQIGKRPTNSGQTTSSLSSSLSRFPWFNSKGTNEGLSASANEPAISFASMFDHNLASSSSPSQGSTTSKRIPFLSQIQKFFSSANFPKPGQLFPQITAKSSPIMNQYDLSGLTNYQNYYHQPTSSRLPNLTSYFPGQKPNSAIHDQMTSASQYSSIPRIGSRTLTRPINRRTFSPSWEESFASSSMLEPILGPHRRSSMPDPINTRTPSRYFSIESGSDGWSPSAPLTSQYQLTVNRELEQSSLQRQKQNQRSRRKRSLTFSKPDYRFSPSFGSTFNLFPRLFTGFRSNGLTFLTNPNKLLFGSSPTSSGNFASASTLGPTYISPGFHSQSLSSFNSPYLSTTLRPVFTRQYETSSGFNIPFASIASPSFANFPTSSSASANSLGLSLTRPHHIPRLHHALGLDSPYPLSSMSFEDDLKEHLLQKQKYLTQFTRPHMTSANYYDNNDFNPLSALDLNDLNEYDSPPLYEAYSKAKTQKDLVKDSDYYYRPVSLHKGPSKRPPKRERVPDLHGSSYETYERPDLRPNHEDDTSYSDNPHSSSSSPVHSEDEAYYKDYKDSRGASYESGPDASSYTDKDREQDSYSEEADRPENGNYQNENYQHRPAYDQYSEGKEYSHYSSIDHYPEDSYESDGHSSGQVTGIDEASLVPPYAKDLPTDPDAKQSTSPDQAKYSTVSHVYRPNLSVHQHQIHHHVGSSVTRGSYPNSYYTEAHSNYYNRPLPASPAVHNSETGNENGVEHNVNSNNNNNNANNFKIEVIEDDYNQPSVSRNQVKHVKTEKPTTQSEGITESGNEEQAKNYGYSPQSTMKLPYDYENTKIFINHDGGDHGRHYIGQAYSPSTHYDQYGKADYHRPYYPEPQRVNTPLSQDNQQQQQSKNEQTHQQSHFNQPVEYHAVLPSLPVKPSPSIQVQTPRPAPTKTPAYIYNLNPVSSRPASLAELSTQKTSSGSAHQVAARARPPAYGNKESQTSTTSSTTTTTTPMPVSTDKSNGKVSLFKKQRPEFTKLAYKYKPSAYQQSRREALKPGEGRNFIENKATPSPQSQHTTTSGPIHRYTAASAKPVHSNPSTTTSSSYKLPNQLTTTPPSVSTALNDLDLASYGVRINKGNYGSTTKRPSVSIKASYSSVSSSSAPITVWEERKRDDQVKKQEQFKKQLIEQQQLRVQQLYQEKAQQMTKTNANSKLKETSKSESTLVELSRNHNYGSFKDGKGSNHKSSEPSVSSNSNARYQGHIKVKPSMDSGAAQPVASSSSSSITTSSSSSSSPSSLSSSSAVKSSNGLSVKSPASSYIYKPSKTKVRYQGYSSTTTRRPSAYRSSTAPSTSTSSVSELTSAKVSSSVTTPSSWSSGYIHSPGHRDASSSNSGSATVVTSPSYFTGTLQGFNKADNDGLDDFDFDESETDATEKSNKAKGLSNESSSVSTAAPQSTASSVLSQANSFKKVYSSLNGGSYRQSSANKLKLFEAKSRPGLSSSNGTPSTSTKSPKEVT